MMTIRNPNIEKEVKFIIKSNITIPELNQFLIQLQLSPKHQVFQKDVYWDNQNCKIINLKRGLRIRYISNKVKDFEFKSLFKGQNGQYVVEEQKLLVNGQLDVSALKKILVNRLNICRLNNFESNFYSLESYLSKLGLLPIVTLEKNRSIWIDQNNEIEVSVDIISNLGTFVEVEQVSNFNQIYNKVVYKLENSNFTIRDITHSGYLDLILNKNDKIISKSEFERKFTKNNMWNIQHNEKHIYLSLTK